MSDAFFQAIITVSALFISVGALLTVNAMKEVAQLEFRTHSVVRVSRYQLRILLLWLYTGSLIFGILLIIMCVYGLWGSSLGYLVPTGYSNSVAYVMFVYAMLFSFSAGGNIGAVWRSGGYR